MTFDEAIASSGINEALTAITTLSPNGRPPISQEAADLHLQIARAEKISSALISFTHLCEASFNLRSVPNTNGNDKALVWWDFTEMKMKSWDLATFQMNFLWTMRSVAAKEFTMDGLAWADVWGTVFYDADGKPAVSNNDPFSSGRLAARKLLSKQGTDRFRAVMYTGPTKQVKRGDLYDSLIDYFAKFFESYG